MDLVRRWGATPSVAIFAVWLAVGAAMTVEPFVWHVEYFRSPGETFYRLILVVLPALAAGAAGYAWLRRRGWWRWEPAGLSAAAVIAAAAYRPLGTAAALALSAAFVAVGGSLTARLGATPAGPAARLAWAFGVGAGVWMTALFPLGLAGWWTRPVILLLLAASLYFGRRGLADALAAARELQRSWSAATELRSPWVGAPMLFAWLFPAITLAVALAPPLAFDALRTHLPSVEAFAAQGSPAPLPHLSYSLYPQGFESLLTAGFLLAGRGAAQALPLCFTAATLLAFAALGRQIGLRPAALVPSLVFIASFPFLVWTGGIVKNDLAMTLFQALALLACLSARGEDAERRAVRLRWGVAFLALGFSVKYTAVFGAAGIGLLYLASLVRLPRPTRELALWALLFVALFGVWPARAFVHTGNPIYPTPVRWISALQLFDPPQQQLRRPPDGVPLDRFRGAPAVPLWEIPWKVHFDTNFLFRSPSDNSLGFLLVLFLPVWLLTRRSDGASERGLGLFVLGAFLAWAAAYPILRYFIAPLAALTLLTAARAQALFASGPPALRALLLGTAVYNLLFCLLPALIVSVNGPQLLYFAGRIDEAEYLRRTLISYPSLEYLNDAAAPGERVLSVANFSAAYAPDPASFDCSLPKRMRHVLALAPAKLAARRYDWLILPSRPHADALLERLPPEMEAELGYSGPHFRVFRLDDPGEARGGG